MIAERKLLIAAGLALACSTAVLAVLGTIVHERNVHESTASLDFIATSGGIKAGSEIVAALLVSASCPGSRDPRMPSAVADARRRLEEIAASEGRRVVFIGVSLDPVPVMGLRFLERFGPLDEVILGKGWLNTGSLQFMVRDLRGDLAIPQLVVLERTITSYQSDLNVSHDNLLARYVGPTAIASAAEQFYIGEAVQ